MPHRRSLSVQSKLLVSFVLLTITGIAVLTGVGYFTARQSLTASAERQLLGLQRSKAGIVKSMLTSMRNEVLAFSATDVATRAAVALRAGTSVETPCTVTRMVSSTNTIGLLMRLGSAFSG